MQYSVNGTEVLKTAGLRQKEKGSVQERRDFRILQDIVVIHTNEVI